MDTPDPMMPLEGQHDMDAVRPEAREATERLMTSLNRSRSRRTLLKAGIVGAAGVAVAGATLVHGLPVAARSAATGRAPIKPATAIGDVLSIARTAEELAVTFYSHGITNNVALGITGSDLTYLQAAVTEEQIHRDFLKANGGTSLAGPFSFPHGVNTFTRLGLFIDTLEQLEVAFIGAYLAAVQEFAEQGQPGLARIAAQIGGIECEHRAVGRELGGLTPVNNFGFEVATFARVSDAVTALANGGFLSPSGNNSFAYAPVSATFPGVIHTRP
ncbi:MAG: ferritin-like domain-containing protein [Ktedonobacterales bacterium]|nr:ferritin-like domain-containing protein [Ktedonobacterales bacterium]